MIGAAPCCHRQAAGFAGSNSLRPLLIELYYSNSTPNGEEPKYIVQGPSISFVLRVLEVERSTYYAHVSKAQPVLETIHRVGRPVPGLSYTQDGKPVSDHSLFRIITVFAFTAASMTYLLMNIGMPSQKGL